MNSLNEWHSLWYDEFTRRWSGKDYNYDPNYLGESGWQGGRRIVKFLIYDYFYEYKLYII